jgi:PleD family two-component response regulator
MGGTISLTSTFGEGTTMVVTMPFEKASEQQPATPSTTSLTPIPEDFGLIGIKREDIWILLVEDNDLNREFFYKSLQRMRFNVHAVGNGKSALEALGQRRWDVV